MSARRVDMYVFVLKTQKQLRSQDDTPRLGVWGSGLSNVEPAVALALVSQFPHQSRMICQFEGECFNACGVNPLDNYIYCISEATGKSKPAPQNTSA